MNNFLKIGVVFAALTTGSHFATALETNGTDAAEDARIIAELKDLQAAVRDDKHKLIEAQLKLNTEHAAKFWPIYEAHQLGLKPLNNRRIDNVSAYGKAWSAGSIDEKTADTLAKEAFAIEKAEAALLEKTYSNLKGKIPAAAVVRYIQVESRLRSLVRLVQAVQVPLAD